MRRIRHTEQRVAGKKIFLALSDDARLEPAKFYQMILRGGRLGERRLVAGEMLAEMTRVQEACAA